VRNIIQLSDINLLEGDGFVYDIETSKGTFLCGVGSINVKNTDSLYLSAPNKHFDDIDRKYYTNKMQKIDYWNELVNITFQQIKAINKEVNDMLIGDNGTKFLRMAYEEALFPVAFLAKKKYYGIPHISLPNFQPKKLFIRGLEVKKRGVSDMLKKICMGIMWNSVNIDNIHTLLELVEQKIDNIYATNWNFKDFIMTDIYKPTKQNVKVQTFAARMREINVVVKPYERFKYVIVKKNPFKYDERGRKKTLSVGERMEFATRAKSHGMKIDLDYYMQGSVNGQLSRLITYAKMFHVEPASNDLDDLKTADDKIYANACKYVNNYCKRYYTTYQSKGKIYQKIFRVANAAVTKSVKQICGQHTFDILKSNYDVENLGTWLETKAEKKALKDIKGYGAMYVEGQLDKVNKVDMYKALTHLQNIYYADTENILMIREKSFKDRRLALQSQVRDNMANLTNLLNRQTKAVSNISDIIKKSIDIDSKFNEPGDTVPDHSSLIKVDDIDNIEHKASVEFNSIMADENMRGALNKLQYIYINMISNYNFIHKTRAIVDYLKVKRNKILKISCAPESFNINAHIKKSIDAIIKDN
jgi:hypothetical protein